MNATDALILFVRRPERGKVKTRVAATAGDDAALAVYERLLAHTHAVTHGLSCDKYVFYADAIVRDDLWEEGYHKLLQDRTDLGMRLYSAFRQVFGKGYRNVCVIGSDCPGLTQALLEDAFLRLNDNDLVIGPATDGGYYLLGMRGGTQELFDDVAWSTSGVLRQTLDKARTLGLVTDLLPACSDVDTWDDVPEAWRAELASVTSSPGSGSR
ncbi:TIGR04282 family arsenosugar biosynthesis glycosyltransferase [Flaviaesturariibacter amylovorans]|uniref:TIGR04282 family arsenosugar biosynthesis glycosyltransferase n=1 Tax=Flaviaesturariibacter amylovorans TaxID=1084520 RepID=A0ABP8HQ52_9BACT